MTVVVDKKLNKEKSEEVILSLPNNIKPIDLSKFTGKLKWKGNPLKLQQKWRDE
ncbi:MAG: hypothetical protein H0X70_01745 [Segetibacter sp.]|jgi:hypothetical protein|nr:hypothetical protein [Segetibacter sp.]